MYVHHVELFCACDPVAVDIVCVCVYAYVQVCTVNHGLLHTVLLVLHRTGIELMEYSWSFCLPRNAPRKVNKPWLRAC